MSRIDFVTGAPEKYAHLVDALSTLPGRVSAAVEGRPAADLRREPPDGWSAQRILGHVAFTTAANRVFIHQMATMTDPHRAPFPVGHEDDALAQGDPADLVRQIQEETAAIVELLSGTPDASWGRAGYVREARLSLRQMVTRHIEHVEEHIAQIAQVLAQGAAAR
ncbi:MAG: DinB family protein [Dehalococcoidia bacterium]